MDFLAPHQSDSTFDSMLAGYLLEVLPTPGPVSQNAHYAPGMPQIMPSEFLGEPGLDAEIMVGLAQDHASSNSGEYSNEHNGAPLGEPVAHQRSSSAEEHEKSAQRAARVAEKNRCVRALP